MYFDHGVSVPMRDPFVIIFLRISFGDRHLPPEYFYKVSTPKFERNSIDSNSQSYSICQLQAKKDTNSKYSMYVLVYLPTFTININEIHVGKYTLPPLEWTWEPL